jgi:hypothetical protein
MWEPRSLTTPWAYRDSFTFLSYITEVSYIKFNQYLLLGTKGIRKSSTKYMEQSPCYEVNSHPARQEIPRL